MIEIKELVTGKVLFRVNGNTLAGADLRETNLAGIDTCCIGSAYDVNGVGGMGACQMYLEILKSLALKKMEKRS